ncbi:hypothetical protein TTHERM_00840110 (macronuclear) [Tetrahymena thermophila SB210]|uniref:Uncharacterized protein n=1 Tax=Tetrahymena thermophila (strain SB210) TaxID=312017 RepID=I7LXP4_TETTS|nr:hypothetical protein TTHERM_00840110 [Tetrahymena thermophila SB210]EAS05042.2 hypothetical protein TTHERM_00840110 [Tetrahymena thermophila SB210]|eukprot:XP_001025287.2 hypothetical protein TTHERM_00840110 [Tetrahymena thermophila SB210]
MISSNQTADQENKVENKVANAEHVNQQSYDSIPQSLSPAVIAQIMDKGQSQPQSQSLKQIQNEYPQYDWDNKWLKGDEYANMLEKIEEYCKQYNLQKFGKKTHPEDIYRAPQNGLIYFVEGNCVGSEFGFPRVPFRKQYRWKKMNFTTDLPKKRPQVTYIVASSVKCQKSQGNDKSKQDSNKKEQDVYRMHAVILYKNSQAKQQTDDANNNNNNSTGANNSSSPKNSESKQYILCHIRKMDINDEDKIGIKQIGALNSNSASESSQDLAINSNSQKSGKQGKQASKKLIANESKSSQMEQDDDNESDEIDEMEDDEVKENQRQNKRKNSSIYEKGSNQDSYGNQIQTLHPHDTNKQSKAKSKLSSKYQNKLGEKYQNDIAKCIAKVSLESNPDKPTEILNANKSDYIDQSMQYLISCLAQKSAEFKKNKTNEAEKNTNTELNNTSNNNILNIQKKDTENFNISMYSDLKQQPSETLKRKRSPRNIEDNSLTSSSNTNQAKEEEMQIQLQQRQQNFAITGTNPFINQYQANNNISSPMLNFMPHNAMQQLSQSYPYQSGGMVVIQPTANYLQYPPYLILQQILTHNNQNSVSIQQQQLQNFMLHQQPQQIIQDMTRPPAVNLDLLNFYLQNSQNPTELNYRDMYSMQMNNSFSNNMNYLPNQNNQNAP